MNTLKINDIALRETQTTRLIFKPTILNNHSDQNASVKGAFLFQEKGAKGMWSDEENKLPLSLSTLENLRDSLLLKFLSGKIDFLKPS